MTLSHCSKKRKVSTKKRSIRRRRDTVGGETTALSEEVTSALNELTHCLDEGLGVGHVLRSVVLLRDKEVGLSGESDAGVAIELVRLVLSHDSEVTAGDEASIHEVLRFDIEVLGGVEHSSVGASVNRVANVDVDRSSEAIDAHELGSSRERGGLGNGHVLHAIVDRVGNSVLVSRICPGVLVDHLATKFRARKCHLVRKKDARPRQWSCKRREWQKDQLGSSD